MTPLLFKSYMAAILNSENSNQYRNFYVSDKSTGEIVDVLQDGNLSCAIFVTNILHMFSGLAKLIDNPHVTVSTTVKKMKECGWYEINQIKAGAVIQWEEGFGHDGLHGHIGFVISDTDAISTSDKTRSVQRHEINFDGNRKVSAVYWHDLLNQ